MALGRDAVPDLILTLEEQRRSAIRAAELGDWSKADDMELAFLNGPMSAAQEIRQRVEDQAALPGEANARELCRGWGPRGELAVLWLVGATKCAFCDGDGEVKIVGKNGEKRDADCPDCEGTGETDDLGETIYTDIDGNSFPEKPWVYPSL